MREIKFRVWDRCNGRMVDPRNILKICMSRLNQEPYLIVYLRKWMNENREIKESDKCYTNEFELMQYTGLKDKNGKEIYEGDIVKCTDGEDKINELNSDTGIGQVEWFKRFGFWNISGIENGLGDIIQNGYVEIIGNAYENKELLAGRGNDNDL